jgi:hypothetical protein
MKSSFLKISGTCSMIQSFFYVMAVAAISQTPLMNLLGADRTAGMDIFMASYSANPWPVTVMSISFILLGLLGFACVAPATGVLLGEETDGLLKTGRHTGMLCLAVVTAYYVWFLATLPGRAAAFQSLDPPAKALAASLSGPFEPAASISWFMFFGMGLWVAAVGIAAYGSGRISRRFSLVCAVKAGGFWLAHVGIIAGSAPVAITGAVIGGLIGGPVYHLWLGIVMRRAG